MCAQIAFIGLGVMGFPMAGHLARAGHNVTVYNRNSEKAKRWVARHGGQGAPTPALAVRDAEFVFACVGDDSDLRAVTLGADGAFAGMKTGSCFIDHTTCSATVARELHALASGQGIDFIDAPVSGGQAGAENGVLTVMAGGEAKAFARIVPLLECYAQNHRLMGTVGAGQLTKMVNQICIAGLLQGLAEGLHFGRAAGLDLEAVVSVISKGAAQSWQMENRHETMALNQFDFGFAVDWMRKDLAICLQEARGNGAQLPVAALVDQFYAQLQAMGGGRWDTSSLIARLENNGGGQQK
ncbi:MAG TPA: oxidoreductase [Alphaproteobacteria bacterium]|nr:oxidoreductase [Alphaproteobacteria bacterium]